MDLAYVMELLCKQYNVDKNHFQPVIGDGICYVSSISHFLFGLQCKISFYLCLRKLLWKNFVNQDYWWSNYSSFCPVEKFKFHLVLIGSSLDQTLQRLDKYHLTYQIVDGIYTSYKYRFYSNIISSRGEVFNQLNCAVEHNLKCRIPEKLPGAAKKRLLRKKVIRHYLSSAQKFASTQTLGSAFLENIPIVQNSKFEIDLSKIVDCFIDAYGTVNSERINFSIKNWIFNFKNLVKNIFI